VRGTLFTVQRRGRLMPLGSDAPARRTKGRKRCCFLRRRTRVVSTESNSSSTVVSRRF